MIHCCAGFNRSVTVVIVWRMIQSMLECLQAQQADAQTTASTSSHSCRPEGWESILAHIRRSRPAVSPMQEFRDQLVRFQHELTHKPTLAMEMN